MITLGRLQGWKIAGMVPGADMFASWLLGQVADAGRKRLTTWVLGSDQERALRPAAVVAIQRMAVELRPEDDEQAKQIAMVVDEVFGQPMQAASLTKHATLLEALQAGIAEQLTPLGDADLTGTGRSSAEWLGVPVAELAQQLTSHLGADLRHRAASESLRRPEDRGSAHPASPRRPARLPGPPG
jgi:hypothetical protein